MTMKLSDALATDILNAGYAGQFVQNDVLELRSGSPPADANAAQTGTVLATILLPASPFATPSARACAKNGTWQDSSADAGAPTNIGYFVLYKAGDTLTSDATKKRIIGTATATGGGGDMTFDNVSVATGQQITINTFTMSL